MGESKNKNRVQVKHPLTGRWHLLDTQTGRKLQSRVQRFVGVPVREPKSRETDTHA